MADSGSMRSVARRNLSGSLTSAAISTSDQYLVLSRLRLWIPNSADLFTDRQLVALTTFSDLVGEARERIRLDAVAAGLPDDGVPLREGGTGATAYAEAVVCIWRLPVKCKHWSTICHGNVEEIQVSQRLRGRPFL